MHRSFTSNTLTYLFTARSVVLLRLKYFASRNTGSVNCTAFSDLNENMVDSLFLLFLVAISRLRVVAGRGESWWVVVGRGGQVATFLGPLPAVRMVGVKITSFGGGAPNCHGAKKESRGSPKACEEQAPLVEKKYHRKFGFLWISPRILCNYFLNYLVATDHALVVRCRCAEMGAHDVVEEPQRMQM
jgi:hypothetical protein